MKTSNYLMINQTADSNTLSKSTDVIVNMHAALETFARKTFHIERLKVFPRLRRFTWDKNSCSNYTKRRCLHERRP